PVYPDEAGLPPPPGAYRELPQQGSPPAPYRYEPPAAAAQPDATRPPLPISPRPVGAGPAEANATRTTPRPQTAAGPPPEVRPETGPKKQLPPQFRRTLVDYPTKEPAGTIIIDTPNTYLYLVLGQGKALRYGVGVGREGFTWSGAEKVSRMAEWPDWTPP